MKKCNGTGLVLKICETKNNVWKRCEISIQNSIDNHIETTKIKPNFASLNKKFGTFRDWKVLETGYFRSLCFCSGSILVLLSGGIM